MSTRWSGQRSHSALTKGTAADGSERAPMRMAEARLTLGVQAARTGHLEEAFATGERAVRTTRRSLPSLLMVAGELASVLHERYPEAAATRDYPLVLGILTMTTFATILGTLLADLTYGLVDPRVRYT